MNPDVAVEIIDVNQWQRLRSLFNFIDLQDRPWKVQGLGVWTDNYSAIAAYETLGFVTMGENKLSTRVLGKYFQRMIRSPKP
jgi:hypothetical protein